jgi:hypothetical protein
MVELRQYLDRSIDPGSYQELQFYMKSESFMHLRFDISECEY